MLEISRSSSAWNE